MIVETTRKEMKVCSDVIFKAIFLREKEILLKMIYDITDISETMHYEEVLTGYELEPYKVNGKVNKSDMLIKINNRYFINIEVNFKHQKNVLYRNMIQLFRICGQVVESGMTDNELTLKKVGQLNFNTFSNSNNKVLERGYYTNEEGNVLNDLLNIWNIDIVKCYKKVYNNIEYVQKLPKTVRWGALLYANIKDTEIIKKIIGDDLLTMEECMRLVSRIGDVIDDKRIIQEWMVIENNRMREKNVLETAKEDGLEQGIKQGIEQGIEQGIQKSIINMLREGTKLDFISKVTGKSVEEIKKIEENL